MRTNAWLLTLVLTALSSRASASVTVYVVDSGVRTGHRAIRSGARGRDFVGDVWGRTRGALDCHGHGTAVASLIAAAGVEIVSVRVADCQAYSPPERVAQAFAWIERHARAPSLVVASFDVGDAQLVRERAEALTARGVAVVAAAGNAVVDACRTAPGGAPHVLTVASMDAARNAATFSNVGECIDLFAPGEGLSVASHTSDRAMREESGCSMATAYVAGLLARRLTARPRSTPAELEGWLLSHTRADVRLGETQRASGTTTRGLIATRVER